MFNSARLLVIAAMLLPACSGGFSKYPIEEDASGPFERFIADVFSGISVLGKNANECYAFRFSVDIAKPDTQYPPHQ